jgi:hypothetical protein
LHNVIHFAAGAFAKGKEHVPVTVFFVGAHER